MSKRPLVPVNPTIQIPQASPGGRITEELLIDQLRAFYKKYGVIPTTHDTLRVNGQPRELAAVVTYYTHLGASWDEVLSAAGLPTLFEQKETRRKELLDKLVEFEEKHGRAPKSSELGPKYDMPRYGTYRTLFDETWGSILKKVGMQTYHHHEPRYGWAEMRAMIAEYYSRFGTIYDSSQAASVGLPSLQVIQVYMGEKWGRLMVELGYTKELHVSDDRKMLIDELNEFYDKHGRVPKTKELTGKLNMHSYYFYRKVFSGLTFEQMLAEAGLA